MHTLINFMFKPALYHSTLVKGSKIITVILPAILLLNASLPLGIPTLKIDAFCLVSNIQLAIHAFYCEINSYVMHYLDALC